MVWVAPVFMLIISLLLSGVVFAIDDSTPPSITAFNLSPSLVDTQSSDQVVTATFTLTDAQSGVREYGEVDLSSDSSSQLQAAIFHRISGDQNSGTYRATLTLPTGSKNGTWNVSNLFFTDNVGNSANSNKASLEASFGAGVATVTNTATVYDSTPPSITAFNLSSHSINTENADQTVTATMTVTDDQSGARDQPEIILTPSSTSQSSDVLFNRTSGSGLNGTYTATLTFPRGSQAGEWKVSQLTIFDNIGNSTNYNKGSLEGLFGSGVASVTNTAAVSDSSPPQVTTFTLSPTQIDTENASQQVIATFTITDDQAGSRDQGEIIITPLIGTQSGDVIYHRISGDGYNGVYTATFTLPQSSKVGVWQVSHLSVVDNIGNLRTLQADDLSGVVGVEGTTLVNTAEASSVTIDREWKLSSASGYLIFPINTVVTRKDSGSFAFYQMLANAYDVTVRTPNGLRNGVVGDLRIGIPGLNLSFSQPVTVALVVDSSLNGKRLRIQSLGEDGVRWADESQCLVADGFCRFTVAHATYFVATTDISGLLPDTLPDTGKHAD